jgi:hypothetical protein
LIFFESVKITFGAKSVWFGFNFIFGRIQFGILVGPGPLPPPMGPAHVQMTQLDLPPCPPVSPVVDRHLPPPLTCPVNHRTPPSFVPHRTGPPSSSATPSTRAHCFFFTPHRCNRENPPSKDPTTSLSAPDHPFVHPYGRTCADIIGIKAITVIFPLLR